AEVLGDGQAAQGDAQAGAGRLGHLAVHEGGARFRRVLEIDDAALLELDPQVVALARALAHAGEHGYAAVLRRDVVNELLDDDGPDAVLAEMLLDLADHVQVVAGDPERAVNVGQLAALELDVHHRTDDLHDAADVFRLRHVPLTAGLKACTAVVPYSASAPD